MEIQKPDDVNEANKSGSHKRKRGRPKKIEANTVKAQLTPEAMAQRVNMTRRKRKPGPKQQSPYKNP